MICWCGERRLRECGERVVDVDTGIGHLVCGFLGLSSLFVSLGNDILLFGASRDGVLLPFKVVAG